MTKQTAVEWLIKEIKNDSLVMAKSSKEWNQKFEQAKEMEKQQSINDYMAGAKNEGSNHINKYYEINDAVEYYNETYGGTNNV
jgi:hypothetical protein